MADLAFRVSAVIKTEMDVIRAQLSRNGIEVCTGTRQLSRSAPHPRRKARAANHEYEAGHIIIATGTKPAGSPQVPINGRTIINSDQILEHAGNSQNPASSWAAASSASNIPACSATLGVRVTLIEKRAPPSRICRLRKWSKSLCYHLRDRRVTMRLNEEVESVEETPEALVVANLKSKKKVSGDALLYAVGRQGNVDELNLAAAGFEADDRGRIHVDDEYPHQRCPTSSPSATSSAFPALASVSMEQGRIAAANAFGMPIHHPIPPIYPYGIYTIPEISFIGKTEEQLTDEDVPYEVGMAYLPRNSSRPDSRRHHRPPQAHLPSRHAQGTPRGAHHRRRRLRTAAHRSGGLRTQRHDRIFRRYRLQLSDSGGMLQGRRVQRPKQGGEVMT